MEFKTKRLTVKEGDEQVIAVIDAKSSDNSIPDMIASLSEEDLAYIYENKDELRALTKRLIGSTESSEEIVCGAWLGKRLIGYIELDEPHSEVPEIRIAIDRKLHGQGYGYELLSAFLEELKKKGERKNIRYIVMKNNESSIALVKKVGGILQEPQNKVEEIFVKSYLISV